MSIITRKIKLIPVGETSKDRTKVYNFIKDISKELATVGNQIIRQHVNNNFNLKEIIDTEKCTKKIAVEKLRAQLTTSIQNSGYRLTTTLPHIASDIRTNLNQDIYKTITENFYDILNNKVSIPSYKSENLPIRFSNKIYLDNNKYLIDFPITQTQKQKFNNISFELFFGKDKSNNKIIVRKTITQEYKMCNSSLQYNGKDLFLYLTVNIPETKSKDIIPNKTMGIDMGINRPVSFFITDEEKQPYQIDINSKIQHDRMRMLKQRKSIAKALKLTTGGHGRTKKLKALEQFRDKEKNWAQTTNHRISAEVIKIAQQYNVGIIKMEDLTGITKDTDNQFLKSWAYFQLQTYIKYKAEMAGITIQWVKPKDTSRECPTCHTINEENRSKQDYTKFECVNTACTDYLKTLDADIVAATNIAHKLGLEEKPNSKAGRIKNAKLKKSQEIPQQNLELSF
jgi:IS605 OrfB family transposase